MYFLNLSAKPTRKFYYFTMINYNKQVNKCYISGYMNPGRNG
jgi:hypothetical protein